MSLGRFAREGRVALGGAVITVGANQAEVERSLAGGELECPLCGGNCHSLSAVRGCPDKAPHLLSGPRTEYVLTGFALQDSGRDAACCSFCGLRWRYGACGVSGHAGSGSLDVGSESAGDGIGNVVALVRWKLVKAV